MFGLSDNKDQKTDLSSTAGYDHPADASLPMAMPAADPTPSAPPLPHAQGDSGTALPSHDPSSTPSPSVNLDNAYIHTDPPGTTPEPHAQPSAASLVNVPDDELLKMKQQALQSLGPLMNHLDQTPEEKFKTTMMMIQASDNPELIKEAYEAANQITDEKTKAQALLDIVNEINYFTHPGGSTPQTTS